MAIGLLGKGWATYEGLMCVLANSYSEELRTSFNAASMSGLLLRKLISRKGKDQATGRYWSSKRQEIFRYYISELKTLGYERELPHATE